MWRLESPFVLVKLPNLGFPGLNQVMPSPATDAEPVPTPALEAVSEAQDEEEEVDEVEQAEEFTVTAEEVAEPVEAGRDALGDGEEDSEAAVVALEDSNFQGHIEGDSVQAEVRKIIAAQKNNDIFLTEAVKKNPGILWSG